MVRSLCIAFAIFVTTPLVAVPGWIALHRTDLPSIDDSGLVVPRAEIPPAQNGFPDFAEAVASMDWPEGADEHLLAIRAEGRAEPGWVRMMSDRNARALATLRRGLAAPAFQFPARHGAASLDDPTFLTQRLLRLAGAAARLRAAEGDAEGAIENAFLGIRSASRIAGADGIDLRRMILAQAHLAIALADVDHVVRRTPLSRELAKSWIRQLESARWSPADWERVWAAEFEQLTAVLRTVDSTEFEGFDGIPAWASKLVPGDYLWQPNRTASQLAEFYRHHQRQSALACNAEGYPSRARRRETKSWQLLLAPNPAGEWLLALVLPSFHLFDRARCHAETKISLVQALIAVKAYFGDRGRLPDRLEDLIPEYLDAAPEDRFAGAPTRYSRERQVVYSVGDDFTDAGGGDISMGTRSEPALSLAFRDPESGSS